MSGFSPKYVGPLGIDRAFARVRLIGSALSFYGALS